MKVFSFNHQRSIYQATRVSGSVLGDFTHANLFSPNDNPLRLNENPHSHRTDEKTEAQRGKTGYSPIHGREVTDWIQVLPKEQSPACVMCIPQLDYSFLPWIRSHHFSDCQYSSL